MRRSEVLESVAAMPREEWMKIQDGVAGMHAARLPESKTSEIRDAMNEAEAEFSRDQGISISEMRRHFGLQ